ncbi:MAG: pentapeptide repeat-containing protein [Fuerstiella sp.]
MSLPLKLQKISDWISTIASATKTTIEFSVQSGFLQDTMKEICDRGGVAGAVFKLGAMTLDLTAGKADAETRIGAHLSNAFLKTLNTELGQQTDDDPHKFISPDAWKAYQSGFLEDAAKTTLSAEFTWLKVIGDRGRKSSRSWPVVNELADFARRAVWEAADGPNAADIELRQFADVIRGRVHEALARSVDEFVVDRVINEAFLVETPTVARQALELLNEQFVSLKSAYLFNEVPQDALFISPTIKVADYSETHVEEDWGKIESQEGGDDFLAEELSRRAGRRGVIVVEGEMGIGKSCLMRAVASKLAERFLGDKKQAVVSANWRDIYEKSDLIEGVQQHVQNEYGLPIIGLPEEERLVFLIDGFDEMRSHEAAVIDQYFRSLVELSAKHKSPLVLAMRSTVVTDTIRRLWKDKNVLVIKVDAFTDADTDQWARRWCEHRQVNDVTGKGLRQLCGGLEELTRTPLLLFMLARYVQPVAKGRKTALTRSEIFRTFIDETIRGKARMSGEKAGLEVREQNFRHLLQEIAWIASWPMHGGKCPTRVLRERICDSRDPKQHLKEEFGFGDVRTAFVLQFFEPGDHAEEFEFHPEGFRHYLLAEWAVRTQWEAMIYDDVSPSYPTGRSRNDARNALAQFPLREVERHLVNEIYEQLPPMLNAEDKKVSGQNSKTFGLSASASVEQLWERLRREGSSPPSHSWATDTAVGAPKGQDTRQSLEETRLLTNHWDHSLLGLFGLSRGRQANPTLLRKDTLRDIYHLKSAIGQQDANLEYHLSDINLNNHELNYVDASHTLFYGSLLMKFNGRWANFRWGQFSKAVLIQADLRDALLIRANFNDADLTGAILARANLTGATLGATNLTEADLREANLTHANLIETNLTDADLRCANLSGAILNGANLSGARLNGANLSGARLDQTDLSGAILDGAIGVH